MTTTVSLGGFCEGVFVGALDVCTTEEDTEYEGVIAGVDVETELEVDAIVDVDDDVRVNEGVVVNVGVDDSVNATDGVKDGDWESECWKQCWALEVLGYRPTATGYHDIRLLRHWEETEAD